MSPEVRVVIVPDNEEFVEREPDLWKWAGVQCGLKAADIAKYQKKPPIKGKALARWEAATAMVANMSVAAEPWIVEAYPAQVVYDGPRLLASLANQPLALDWEWDIATMEPLGLAVGAADNQWYVPLKAGDYEAPVGEGERLRRSVAKRLIRGDQTTIMHGGRADLRMSTEWLDQIPGNSVDDTMLMAYLLGEPALGLKPLTAKHLGRHPVDFPGNLTQMPVALVARYAGGGDARNTFDLWAKFLPLLAKHNLLDIYENFERPLVPIITKMEAVGSPCDIRVAQRIYDRDLEEMDQLADYASYRWRGDITTAAGKRALIYRQSGVLYPSVDARILAADPGEYVDVCLDWQERKTRSGNFLAKHIAKWQELGRPELFTLHPRFNQAGRPPDGDRMGWKKAPRTGRLSSSDPNFQNQPKKIMEMFVAPPDHLFWSFDYSQLELRIAAALSKDQQMLADILSGDAHARFQEHIFRLSGRHVERTPAKSGNFEQLYGGGPDKLRQILAKVRAFISIEEATAIVDAHRRTYKGYHDWVQQQVALTRLRGYSVTLDGRKRWVPEIYALDPAVRSYGERAAANHVVQGTAADKLKWVMIQARDLVRRFEAHLSLQVHDEICGWVPAARAEEFVAEMTALMGSISINGLPLAVSGGVGKTWAAAKHG